MTGFRHRIAAMIGLAGALALGGCAYDDGYGYGGVSVGTGYYGGGGYYGDGYYGPTGYYQPGLYNGWYDNVYYPGTGYYVYDRNGRRQRWNDGQRRYWEGRRAERRDDRRDDRNYGQWRGRDRDGRDGRGDRDGRWQGRDGQAGNGQNGNWTNRPRPPQGTDTPRGRGNWRGNDAVRPTPQPGLRQPQTRPQTSQPRPQRDWSARPAPSERAVRSRAPGASRQERPD